MSDDQEFIQSLESALVNRRVDVSRVEQTLDVSAGQGITAAQANIDPAPLFSELRRVDEARRERLVEGYASGVKHVLLEPKRSDADEWGFTESAGRLVPNVEVYTFELGAEAAAGEPAWTTSFFEDLVVGYILELDVGMRVLTESQFEDWQATSDRVEAAARSILYHKSQNLKPQALEEFEGVEKLSAGDGYDAMRAIVVSDLFFGEFSDDFRFSMPTQDALLFVRDDEASSVAALREATDALVEEAAYAISRSVYGFELGKPVLVEER